MKASEWLERGQRRLAAAEVLFAGSMFEDSSFLCHQAVGVAFKAVIMHKTERLAPKVHSLQQLAKLAGYGEPAAFAALEPVYTGVRYPNASSLVITKTEAHAALVLVREVLKWSRSRLK